MKKLLTFLVALVVTTTMFGMAYAKDISIGYVLVGLSLIHI